MGQAGLTNARKMIPFSKTSAGKLNKDRAAAGT